MHGNVGQFACIGVLVHTRVDDEQGVRAGDDDGEAEDLLTGTSVEHPAHVAEARIEAARQPGDHGIGLAGGDHAGGEDVAVLIDHPLAIAERLALALQPCVKKVGIFVPAAVEPRVVDLQLQRAVQPQIRKLLLNQILAADDNRRAEPGALENVRRPDRLLLLALGEHHALRVLAHGVEYELHA